ncbi:hypothetical protein QOT17_007432 [Balamuthia mandrillaris]
MVTVLLFLRCFMTKESRGEGDVLPLALSAWLALSPRYSFCAFFFLLLLLFSVLPSSSVVDLLLFFFFFFVVSFFFLLGWTSSIRSFSCLAKGKMICGMLPVRDFGSSSAMASLLLL